MIKQSAVSTPVYVASGILPSTVLRAVLTRGLVNIGESNEEVLSWAADNLKFAKGYTLIRVDNAFSDMLIRADRYDRMVKHGYGGKFIGAISSSVTVNLVENHVWNGFDPALIRYSKTPTLSFIRTVVDGIASRGY